MPVMDGVEATRRLRNGEAGSEAAQIPVIALTAHAFSEDRQRCLEAGMNAFLSKPIEPRSLADLLEDWLGDHKSGSNPGPGPGPDHTPETSQLPIFDREELLQRVMDDEALLTDVLRTFLEEIPERMEGLEQALAAQDLAAVQRQAHTIKGTSANLAAGRVQRAAEALETAVREQDLQSIPARAADLKLQLDLLVQHLKVQLAQQDGVTPESSRPPNPEERMP